MEASPDVPSLATLLLVEDHAGDARLIRRLIAKLRSPRYRVVHVRTLADALLLSEDQPVDMIVSDLHLPDARGVEVVGRIREQVPDVPLVICSGLEDEAGALRAVKAGAQDYLVKGQVTGHTLRRAIRYAIERKDGELALRRLASHDQLTGLPNRSLLRERLQQAIKQSRAGGEPFATVILDLDQFKKINDSLGHDVGGAVRNEAARRLRMTVADTETVARLGGDEFALVLDPAPRPALEETLRRIVSALARPMYVAGHRVQTSGSLGVSLFPAHATDLSGLLRTADMAMYRTKSDGRNAYTIFTDEMHTEAKNRLALEWALKRAVDDGQFELFYQPQISLQNGQTTGFEALIRWRHPTRGLLTPYHFIDALEEFGLIVEVGEWVLREACRQARRWYDAGYRPLRVSANVSAKQFDDADLVTKVRSAISDAGIRPNMLELEVTESLLMRDAKHASEVLSELSALGVRIAIDDFGTGYSSLAYLHGFPLDVLKIDRTFVETIGRGDRGTAISQMIVALARHLGLEVVAEGIETEVQRDYLLRGGCDVAQGYLYARPLPREDADEWLSSRRAIPEDSRPVLKLHGQSAIAGAPSKLPTSGGSAS